MNMERAISYPTNNPIIPIPPRNQTETIPVYNPRTPRSESIFLITLDVDSLPAMRA